MYDYKFTRFNRCTAGDGNKEKTKPISVGVWPKVQETQEKERNIAVGKQGQSRWRYTQTKIELLYVSIKKIGLHVPIILFRKNQITYNFYTFVSEIKHETSKATEAEIKVISTTTGISKLSKTLLKKNSRLSQQYNNVLSYQKTIVYSMYPVQIGLCLSTISINLLTSAKPCDFFLSISL